MIRINVIRRGFRPNLSRRSIEQQDSKRELNLKYSLHPDLSDLVAKLQKKPLHIPDKHQAQVRPLPDALLLALFAVVVRRRHSPANVFAPSPSPVPRSRRLPLPCDTRVRGRKTSRRVVPLPRRPVGELGSSTTESGQGACLVRKEDQ
jgi:hypothetical protein